MGGAFKRLVKTIDNGHVLHRNNFSWLSVFFFVGSFFFTKLANAKKTLNKVLENCFFACYFAKNVVSYFPNILPFIESGFLERILV